MRKFYDKIQRVTDNPYLNLYCIDARTKSGDLFNYYFASRNGVDNLKHKTHSMRPEGIAIYAVNEKGDRIVLLRQYRYPINDFIYELPAGLIEPNESEKETAVREMWEETGLQFMVYEGGQEYYRRPFFLAQGLTDESGAVIFGTVTGKITMEYQEDSEEIEVIFADKEEVRRILREERISVRAAYLLMQFLHSNIKEPFQFLED